MGNSLVKTLPCFHGSSHPNAAATAVVESEPPLDVGHGHSFVYLGPPPPHLARSGSGASSSSRVHHSEDAACSAFLSISGAAVSANAATPLSTAPFVLRNDLACSSAASFESSSSFAAAPLQPRHSASLSGSDRHYFNSGPLDRGGFHSGPLDQHRRSSASASTTAPFQSRIDLRRTAARRRRTAPTFIRRASKAISRAAARLGCIAASTVLADKPIGATVPNFIANLDLPGDPSSNSTTITSSGNDQSSIDCAGDESDSPDMASGNLHWAQGKAGEDRVHVVVSEEHGWVYVGIYDGFNGPDATDYVLANLYPTVHSELKGLLWTDDGGGDRCIMEHETGSWEMNKRLKEQLAQPSSGAAVDHRAVLRALSRALRKTEQGFLRMTDVMIAANPELAMMGSCVLAVLMRGEDVYLVNVGDSRAVLARRAESHLWNLVGQATQDLNVIKDETLRYLQLRDVNELVALQLTSDHTTCNDEEARRIRSEHPDDPLAIVNSRVKGSLKLTRAFGAGYLKQPKWNNALLGAFRVDYKGSSPYITCNPSLCYHRLGPKDKYLILSSDGLYQYFTNEEVVAQVEVFIATNPEGDPAQNLVQEVLYRAADRAGMDFNQLLQVPQGDRRRYHDDVSIIIISLEGRMWRSCA